MDRSSVLADPRFSVEGFRTTGNLVFELYDAGGTGTAVWTGDDQTSAVQIAYDADNVYFGFVVTDEYHENAALSAWNGDSVQLMIADGAQDLPVLDGQPIQVLTPGQWARIPDSWLQNLHKSHVPAA
jgi:hypothetical protein